MISIPRYYRDLARIMTSILFAGVLLPATSFVHAQALKCASGALNDPDYPFNGVETDVEQTVCVSSSFSYASIENDSYATYGDLSTLGVYGISEEAYIMDPSFSTTYYDSGMQYDATDDTGGSPIEIDMGGVQPGNWIGTSYNECMNQAYYYDSDPNQCYWDFPTYGFWVQMPNPPTLTLSSSGSPSATGQSVTFTATLSVAVASSYETMYFYDGGTQIGTATINGNTASLTTSSLTTGLHSIMASYLGDSVYAAVSSTLIPQAVGVVYAYTMGPNGTWGFDGDSNVLNYIDSVTGIWSFGYDNLNRMTNATLSPSIAGNSYYCWQYDHFGNRTNEYGSDQAFVATQPCQPSSSGSLTDTWAAYTVDGTSNTVDNGKNQISAAPMGGYVYDSAGDVMNDSVNLYLYDAEGRVCAVYNGSTITGYLYNAFGQRVATGSLSSFACNTGFTPNTEEAYGQDGEELMGASANGGSLSWQHTNVYALGSLFATYDSVGLHFQLTDWLGNKRVQTNYAGAVEQTCQNLPFGNQLNCTASSTAPNNLDYAGLQYDAESGLYHATARQYGPVTGRWTAPDPFDGSMDVGEPQTLNRYNYVGNNPLIYTDPDGLSGESPIGAVGGGFGCYGAAASGGQNYPADVGCAYTLISDLVNFFLPSHPKLKGTTAKRPAVLGSGDFGVPYPGLNRSIAGALGLPSGGCEFGVCGGGIDSFAAGAASAPASWCLQHPKVCTAGIELADVLEKIPPIAASALLLNMKGDNKADPNRCVAVRQRAIAACTDIHIGTGGRRDNSGAFFACIRKRMEAEGCQY